MSMKKLAIVLILVFLSPSLSLASDNQFRTTGLYTVFNATNFKDFGAGSTNGFTFQAGLDVSKYLALEGHLGMANDAERSQTIGTDTYDTSVRAAYASLVSRGNLRFDKTTVFAYVGMTYRTLNGAVDYVVGGIPGSSNIDEGDSGATYGFGIDLYGSKTTALTFKVAKLYKDKDFEDADIDVTMFGITHYLD